MGVDVSLLPIPKQGGPLVGSQSLTVAEQNKFMFESIELKIIRYISYHRLQDSLHFPF